MNTGVYHVAQDAPIIQEHIAEHDLRTFGPKSLMKQKLQIVPLTANHAADSILSSPGATGQTVATEEVNTNQIVERDGDGGA